MANDDETIRDRVINDPDRRGRAARLHQKVQSRQPSIGRPFSAGKGLPFPREVLLNGCRPVKNTPAGRSSLAASSIWRRSSASTSLLHEEVYR